MAAIQYARSLEYFAGSLTAPGAAYREPWKESRDNPLSSNFVALEHRREQDRARWWALHSTRRQHAAAGVFDG